MLTRPTASRRAPSWRWALLTGAALSAARPATAQLAPPSTGGVVELDRLLQRIAEPRRLLVIGAHPDDENTDLLALASLGYGARAAYLSLSRGEGGQNLIGEELGAALGLLRSRELLAARSTDGAQQFFSRAFDFGFSRSLEEASRFWPPDSVLKDVVRIVRRFRPDVVFSVFSGTPRDGHGQHQAAGVAAMRAFEVAADSAVFPELASQEGLRPWQPQRLYRSGRFGGAAGPTLDLATGTLEPHVGRSYHQIAMASRSLHRSQDMGQLQRMGPSETGLLLVKAVEAVPSSGSAADTGLFTGIPRHETWLTRLADSLRLNLSAENMGSLTAALAGAEQRLDEDPSVADSLTRAELERALAVASGVMLDATSSAEAVVAGDQLSVTVDLFNDGPQDLMLDTLAVLAPRGWRVEAKEAGPAGVAAGTILSREFIVALPSDAPASDPYFLRYPRVGDLYDWSHALPELRGLPFDPPLLQARAVASVAGGHMALGREVTYRFDDQAVGEIRRPLHVVPAVEVHLEPDLVVWPTDIPTRTFRVTLQSHAATSVRGQVRLEVPGWSPPAPVDFALAHAGDARTVTLPLSLPRAARSVSTTARAVARLADGREFSESVAMVEYPHIRPTPWLRPATAMVRVAPIALPHVSRVGYIRGASDRVPEALQDIALPLTLLTPQRLAREDLSAYDAIIVGSRAYETDTALVHHNQRLLDYVRQGGLMLVQYQQYPFIQGKFAPYPLTIARPHDRVTDETAPVRVLEPNHPAFTTPNAIGSADWSGWPQERGLYFAHEWDSHYTPLLEMHDPDFPPLRGGVLVAHYGSGIYIYTGLSFFRALPAGVPGAYRLFLNLLALRGR